MKTIYFFLCLLVISVNVKANDFPLGAVSTSTGGSGRGAIEPMDGVLLNPAILPLLRTKSLSFDYKPNQWGLLIADNGRDSLFPAALAFSRSEIDNLKTQQLGLSLGYSYKQQFSAGMTVSMYEYDQTLPTTDQRNRQTIGDFGLTYSPFMNLSFGLVAYRIFASPTDLPADLQKQKKLGLGTSFTFKSFARLRFDIESGPDNKTKNLVYMGGLETFINDWIVTRFGYQNDNVVKKNYLTAGLGFAGPQFGLHYAYIANVADSSNTQHSIDLGVPF